MALRIRATDSPTSSAALLGPSVIWLAVFFLAPLSLILVYSLAERGVYGGVQWNLTLENYRRSLDPLYLNVYWRSLVIATGTTAICLVVSYPVAYAIALKANPRWKNTLLLLSIVPFWTSFLLRTYAWMFLLRTEGFINLSLMKFGFVHEPVGWLLYSDFAVLIGQVYGELPFMILPLYVSLERMDVRLVEAAMDLGANRFTAFIKVVIPMTSAGIITAIVLVFIPSLGAFITPDLLGGAKSVMIGNVIQNQFIQRHQPLGSALSILLTVVILALLLIAVRSGKGIREEVPGGGH